MNFASYLNLRDPARDTLQPDPERDVGLYVDLDGLVDKSLSRLAARAPKLVLMGDYGTGKTHLLHVLQSRIDRERFEPVYLKLQAFGRYAEAKHLNADLLTALEKDGRLQAALSEVEAAPYDDLQIAVDLLRKDPRHPEARAWLFGRGPSPAKALKAGFSGSQQARGVQFANLWRYLADGYRRARDRELLFLIDEVETFQELVDQARAADMGTAVREMFDTANRSYGVVMGLTAPKGRVHTFSQHPLGRPDVSSRVQDVMLHLDGLNDAGRRRRFLNGLLDQLLSRSGSFLTEAAVESLVVNGQAWASRQVVLQRDPVQREYVKLLDFVARRAFEQQLPLPISDVELVDGTTQ